MMALAKSVLLDGVLSGVRSSGWYPILRSDDHPYLVELIRGDESLPLKIYVWRVTGGGRRNLPEEFRIQVTTPVELDDPPGYQVLVLGWFEPGAVVAAFDPRPRAERGAQSQSVQIALKTLEAATDSRLEVEQRTPDEIAVAFPPELLPIYVQEQAAIHGFTTGEEVEALRAAGGGEEPSEETIPQDEGRRVILQTVARKVRSATFRRRVLRAYGGACAICGLQLELVEAAHVVPVSAPEGTDDTANGLALCPLHHRAFDAGLIGVAPDYRVVHNEERLGLLRGREAAAGEEDLLRQAGQQLLLPDNERDRPRPEYLRRGLELRGWA